MFYQTIKDWVWDKHAKVIRNKATSITNTIIGYLPTEQFFFAKFAKIEEIIHI